jgi:hypothetical protein
VEFNIRDNCIYDLRFSGDFFGLHPVEEFASLLEGCSLEPEKLLKKIQSCSSEKWIAGISPEELLTLFV